LEKAVFGIFALAKTQLEVKNDAWEHDLASITSTSAVVSDKKCARLSKSTSHLI
jgi:hypothetical protein